MNLDMAKDIYDKIQACKNQHLKEYFVSSAIRYARLRVDWLMSEGEERLRLDEIRRSAHNALISALDSLSRNLGEDGENISWRGDLGSDRKAIGDLACFLHCILGISAR